VVARRGGFLVQLPANVPEIIDLSKASRTLLPQALIMVGGHSASFTATEILQH
jgi:hypothetical protein